MAYTDTWNAAFEALPADVDNISEGADRIRDTKLAVRERLAKDHYFDIAGIDADHGEHSKVTLRVGAAPTAVANKGILYAKDVSAKAELFYIDEDGDEVQLTTGGSPFSFASGTKMVFYQDTAPTGWTIQNTLNDKVLFVTKGSAAGGQTGGGAHSTGTWTQPGHTHTGPSHTHTVATPSTGWTLTPSGVTGALWSNVSPAGSGWYSTSGDTLTSSAGGTGATGSSATAATWRPAAYCCIIAEKD